VFEQVTKLHSKSLERSKTNKIYLKAIECGNLFVVDNSTQLPYCDAEGKLEETRKKLQ
jgi:hypothetical protein